MDHRHCEPGNKVSFCASTRHLRLLLIAAAWLLASTPVRAALGGLPSPDNRSEPAVERTTRSVLARQGYEVRQLTLASGTVVREFVAPSGTVFGVAWQGPFMPDLSSLLGEHFPRLVDAANKPRGDHRMLALHEPDLVIESGGKMRGFAGRAYLPAMVPANVLANEIR
jgi:hypothetical protein